MTASSHPSVIANPTRKTQGHLPTLRGSSIFETNCEFQRHWDFSYSKQLQICFCLRVLLNDTKVNQGSIFAITSALVEFPLATKISIVPHHDGHTKTGTITRYLCWLSAPIPVQSRYTPIYSRSVATNLKGKFGLMRIGQIHTHRRFAQCTHLDREPTH